MPTHDVFDEKRSWIIAHYNKHLSVLIIFSLTLLIRILLDFSQIKIMTFVEILLAIFKPLLTN